MQLKYKFTEHTSEAYRRYARLQMVKAYPEDAGLDLVAYEWELEKNTLTLNTGVILEPPPGYHVQIYSRSGHGFNSLTRLVNSVGVIDSGYRGPIKVKLINDVLGYGWFAEKENMIENKVWEKFTDDEKIAERVKQEILAGEVANITNFTLGKAVKHSNMMECFLQNCLLDKMTGFTKPIAQAVLVPTPQYELVEAEELSLSSRAENGFGSTDKLQEVA